MNYNANIVEVNCNNSKSTGYAFKSACNKSKYIITSKHSICLDKKSCVKLLDYTANPCRECIANVAKSEILIVHNKKSFIVNEFYLSDNADVSILEVNNEILGLNYLTCSPESKERYEIWKYDQERILLNAYNIVGDGYALYNVESNVVADLKAKKNVIPGFSGTPVFTEGVQQPICHSIITDNENLNNVGAEILNKNLLSELSEKSGVVLDKSFSFLSNQVDENFIVDNFQSIHQVVLSNGIVLKIYTCLFNNQFILNKVAEYLVKNLTKNILSPKDIEENTQGDFIFMNALGRFINESSNIYSKSSLLQCLIESDVFAPTLYKSSSINDFNSIHLKESFPNKYEFIFTKFYSSESIIESISNGVEDIKKAKILDVNNNSNMMLSDGVLNQSVSSEQAEILSRILRPDCSDDINWNYGLLSTFVPNLDDDDLFNERNQIKKMDILKSNITRLFLQNKALIDDVFSDKTLRGSDYYLYLIPINYVGELRILMKQIIDKNMA